MNYTKLLTLLFTILVYSLLANNPIYALPHNSKPHAGIETVVVMRHGEKPSNGLGQITCAGLNRALALANVLSTRFGKPDYIFAPNPLNKVPDPSGLEFYVRPLATIEPTAIKFGETVITPHGWIEGGSMGNDLTAAKYRNSLIFVAWEFNNIQPLVKKIISNANEKSKINVPAWSSNEFDALYIVKIDWRTSPAQVSFSIGKQNLNGQSSTCPNSFNPTIPAPATKVDDDDTTTVVFVPAAETVGANVSQLSGQGLQRALQLAPKLKKLYPSVNKFVMPLSSSLDDDGVYYLDALMTIEPAVVKYGKSYTSDIDLKNEDFEFTHTVKMLNKMTEHDDNKSIIVTLPFNITAKAAQAFFKAHKGNPNIIPNPVPNHDTIYQITLRDDKASFKAISTK